MITATCGGPIRPPGRDVRICCGSTERAGRRDNRTADRTRELGRTSVAARSGRTSARPAVVVHRGGRAVPHPDGGELTITAVPAVHGPEDGERDADGDVNCQVVGFVLAGDGQPTVYVSGDNASLRTVTEIARRTGPIDATVLHAGAARVPGKFRQRPVSLGSARAAAAAAILGAPVNIPAHYTGWAHFTEGREAPEHAFDDAGLTSVLCIADHGTWLSLKP
ncbi:MBL fold metallo-hydrolase [Streptomyces sichuanensis]|uniref:MBL fold metallo-hydrolase n=1 Tax=Streptomyces sichuanensis TaxID=2871810 RepID=UPI003556688D